MLVLDWWSRLMVELQQVDKDLDLRVQKKNTCPADQSVISKLEMSLSPDPQWTSGCVLRSGTRNSLFESDCICGSVESPFPHRDVVWDICVPLSGVMLSLHIRWYNSITYIDSQDIWKCKFIARVHTVKLVYVHIFQVPTACDEFLYAFIH